MGIGSIIDTPPPQKKGEKLKVAVCGWPTD